MPRTRMKMTRGMKLGCKAQLCLSVTANTTKRRMNVPINYVGKIGVSQQKGPLENGDGSYFIEKAVG
jgi:hypothetical protein